MPVLVTLPHSGCHLAPGMERRMTERGRQLPDTDWYMEHLYAGALSKGMGVLKANHSRYVVDLNRGADDAALYPGRPSTGLVPALTFDGQPIYHEGRHRTKARLPSGGRLTGVPIMMLLRKSWSGFVRNGDGRFCGTGIPSNRPFPGCLRDTSGSEPGDQ